MLSLASEVLRSQNGRDESQAALTCHRPEAEVKVALRSLCVRMSRGIHGCEYPSKQKVPDTWSNFLYFRDLRSSVLQLSGIPAQYGISVFICVSSINYHYSMLPPPRQVNSI
eukprot:6193634-Pleurochrysis_carterae.AAC.2